VDDPFQQLRDIQAEMLAGADAFDREYYRRFGRFPAESELSVASVRDARRRAAIQQLVEHGATPGERAAAQAALQRLDVADAIGEFPAHQFEQDDPFEED
jgi:hypothetical protein